MLKIQDQQFVQLAAQPPLEVKQAITAHHHVGPWQGVGGDVEMDEFADRARVLGRDRIEHVAGDIGRALRGGHLAGSGTLRVAQP